ncbi:MAG: putative sugar nucleotidyl transferase [Flavobacteriales bacterium]|nr:putative sugar nucleotidyl transferase [Flavobacteriales bacterium]
MISRINISIELFEDEYLNQFYPLIETRPLGELRMGIYSNSERWMQFISGKVNHQTRLYLKSLFPPLAEEGALQVNACVIPDQRFADSVSVLKPNECLWQSGRVLASFVPLDKAKGIDLVNIEYEGDLIVLKHITDLFLLNDKVIRHDFENFRIRTGQTLSAGNILVGPDSNLFISPGAKVNASIINTETGPVYIGHGAEVMEGSMIRGPFVLGDHSTLKMGAKVYGATTIGPHCKIGGEVSNSVISGFSNKAHDGFLGNSVLGEWCNLGADTNNSNLKNNYGSVSLWNKVKGDFDDTGLIFCGLMMGDHSKCGINTMFNTGTVVSTCCNLFGGGYMPRFVPSFSWGGSEGLIQYNFEKAIETASMVMERRQMVLDQDYKEVLWKVFEESHTDKIKP